MSKSADLASTVRRRAGLPAVLAGALLLAGFVWWQSAPQHRSNPSQAPATSQGHTPVGELVGHAAERDLAGAGHGVRQSHRALWLQQHVQPDSHNVCSTWISWSTVSNPKQRVQAWCLSLFYLRCQEPTQSMCLAAQNTSCMRQA